MMKIFSVLFSLVIFLPAVAQVDFREIHSSEEMERIWTDAGALNKPVFIDIYADWCGPCKWMDANVFALEEAGMYMNKAFINVKMNGESQYGSQFAVTNGLSAYPSFFVFSSERKLMNVIVGAKSWEELEGAITSTLDFYPVLEVLQSKFESGLLKQDEYPRFLNVLRRMGKIEYAESVAGIYEQKFLSGTSERTLEDMQVMAFYTRQQTDNWSHLTSDITKLREALGDDLEPFIDHIVTESIELAVENNDIAYIDLLSGILPQLTRETGTGASILEGRMYVYYYHYTGKFDELIVYIDKEFETRYANDHQWLFEAASNAVFLDPGNRVLAERGLVWFQQCINFKETHEYYYHLAFCQYYTGSPEKTIQTLMRSMEFTDDPEITASTQLIIEQVSQELSE